jgi:hypothetical protein
MRLRLSSWLVTLSRFGFRRLASASPKRKRGCRLPAKTAFRPAFETLDDRSLLSGIVSGLSDDQSPLGVWRSDHYIYEFTLRRLRLGHCGRLRRGLCIWLGRIQRHRAPGRRRRRQRRPIRLGVERAEWQRLRLVVGQRRQRRFGLRHRPGFWRRQWPRFELGFG